MFLLCHMLLIDGVITKINYNYILSACFTNCYKHTPSPPPPPPTCPLLSAVDIQGKPVTFHCLHETQRHAKCLQFILRSCNCNDPSIVTDQAGSPLLCAICEGGYVQLLSVLLESGTDINVCDPLQEGKPAIVLSAEEGHHECVRMLLEHGANASLPYGERGLCVLHRYVGRMYAVVLSL